MEKFKNLLTLVIMSLIYYGIIAFISWDFGFQNWNFFERFIYIVLILYTIKYLNSDKNPKN